MTVLRLLVGARFQVLFHSPLGVLFTFPSRYSSTIGHGRVLSLGGWSPLIPTAFPVCGGTWDLSSRAGHGFGYGALTRCGRASQLVPLPSGFVTCPHVRGHVEGGPATPVGAAPPRCHATAGLGCPGFARRYSRGLG